MHIEGPPRVDRPWREYGDVVDHLRAWFEGRVELARELGVAEEQIAIDPGLDFDLSPEQDLEILRRLGELRGAGAAALRLALAQGLHRRRPRRLLGGAAGPPPSASGERSAATALAVREGADVLRIHDRSSLQAMRVAGADRTPPHEARRLQAGMHRFGDPRQAAEAMAVAGLRSLGRSRSSRRGATGGSSPRAPSRSGGRGRWRCRRSLDPGFAEALRRAAASSASTRTSSRACEAAAALQPGDHQRHRLGQEPRLQPAGARRHRPRAEARAPSTSTRPRRSPRTRRASWRSCARPACARRSTTATPRASERPAIRRAATSSSPTRTCSTSASCPTTRAGATSSPTSSWVVVDEAHTYRGVFGSHVANVLRRLRRVARAYGSEPRFLLASATIANPVELAERPGRDAVRAGRRRRRAAGRARDRRCGTRR